MGATRASCTQIGEAFRALGWQPKLKMREPKRRCGQHQKQIRMEPHCEAKRDNGAAAPLKAMLEEYHENAPCDYKEKVNQHCTEKSMYLTSPARFCLRVTRESAISCDPCRGRMFLPLNY